MNVLFDVVYKVRNEGASLTNKDRGRPTTVVDNEVLWTIVGKNPGNAIRDHTDLVVSPTTISRHLKLIGKVKKK